MKRIAVLTSGGDAPGMNACIRAIVLTAEHFNVSVIGFRHGYYGLLNSEHVEISTDMVSNIIQNGGTILHSARCPEFKTEKAALKAANSLDALGIDALLVIGGDGSFHGAHHLQQYWHKPVIGLPGTIDNDIYGTDATIGYFTAIETALDAIDKIRDTADAFERVFLIEVMGRHAGFIGLSASISSGADQVLLPEINNDNEAAFKNLVARIETTREKKGQCSYIVVVAENLWPGGVTALAEKINSELSIESRPVVLGHIQRGGSPSPQDRILATKLGAYAVECALQGKSGIMVGEQNQQLVEVSLPHTWQNQKPLDPYLVKIQTEFFDILE
ncbi:ATP-dependent 6-phosphofructokinase [Planctobacterium marinum]